jgi:hypothetical protein
MTTNKTSFCSLFFDNRIRGRRPLIGLWLTIVIDGSSKGMLQTKSVDGLQSLQYWGIIFDKKGMLSTTTNTTIVGEGTQSYRCKFILGDTQFNSYLFFYLSTSELLIKWNI